MKTLFLVLFFASLSSAPLTVASEVPSAPASAVDPADAERARALAAAKSLCPDYFVKRYQENGAQLKCSLQLDKPAVVQGWTGRWRMRGLATLRHYRDPAVDASLASREEDIRNNKNLSARQIRSQVESLYFIRSEIVEFDVEVTLGKSAPEIAVTVR